MATRYDPQAAEPRWRDAWAAADAPLDLDAFLAGELKTLRRAAARKGLDGDESLLMRFLEKLPPA